MKEWENKEVFVKLNSDRIYTGKIIEVTFLGQNQAGADLYLLLMVDKYGCKVTFSNTEIKSLEEKKQ